MKTRKDGAVRRQLSTLFSVGAIRELTDGQLLERFSTGRGEAAELAFEALVERHAAMVLRVCRAQRLDTHDAQDALQATFLILVRKARGVWVQDSLGPWLHQVARRTALCARAAAARRRRHERRAAELAVAVDHQPERTGIELETALHEEINRLPECYRVPIVLCDLEGCTCEEAARRMGRPVGTVKSWRSRGRERLRRRLMRFSLAPSAGPALAPLPQPTPDLTAHVTACCVAHRIAAGDVPASVHTLIRGVFKTMLLSKLRTAGIAAFALSFLTAGFGVIAWVVADDSHRAVDNANVEAAGPAVLGRSARSSLGLKASDELWSLTLREAIGIGLDNSKTARLISIASERTPFKIAPKYAVDFHRFQSLAMAEVRSIEQQYWNLVGAHVALWAAERAVALAGEIHTQETAKLEAGHGTMAAVALAAQALEQLKLSLMTRTSDVMTIERLLRDRMGLPAANGRRIVPVTAPTEAKLEPDWEQSRVAMLQNQPDITRSRAIIQAAQRDASAEGFARLERSKAYDKELVHQTTHSLARFFLEIDANYKQFKTGSRLRVEAAQRLDAQRAYFEEGKTTIDRLLNSVSEYATAAATEAQYRSSFNVSIVALEEAKGTLLEHDQIMVVHTPNSPPVTLTEPDSAMIAALVQPAAVTQPGAAMGPTAFPPRPTAAPEAMPSSSPVPASKPNSSGSATKAESGGKTFSFEMAFKIGSQPIEIRGSLAIKPDPMSKPGRQEPLIRESPAAGIGASSPPR